MLDLRHLLVLPYSQMLAKPMKLSIDNIPPKWADLLRKKAIAAGYKSVGDYMRFIIAQMVEVEDEFQPRTWGGPRQVPQDEQVEQDAALDTPKPSSIIKHKATMHVKASPKIEIGDDDIHYEDIDET